MYTYKLILDNSEENNFTLYVPIPILENGSIFKAMNNIYILHGNVTIEFIETIHGKALNITGQGNFKLEAKLNGSTKIELSMGVENYTTKDTSNREYWLYYNNIEQSKSEISNIKIISYSNNWVENNQGIKIKMGASFNSTIEGDLIQGWQKIGGIYNVIYSD